MSILHLEFEEHLSEAFPIEEMFADMLMRKQLAENRGNVENDDEAEFEPSDEYSNDDSVNEEDDEDLEDLEEMMVHEEVAFFPQCIYRNNLEGTLELEVDFDATNLNKVSLVIARYKTEDEESIITGNWHICKVCPTRRAALEHVKNLEENDGLFSDDFPWSQEGGELEMVSVATLDVED